MANNAILTTSIQWTPPSAPANSGLSSFVITASYNESNVGAIGIPASTAPATDFVVPFGTVGKAKVVAIRNLSAQELELKVNGAVTSTFNLPAGSQVQYAAASEQAADEWTSATVSTTGTNTSIERVEFWIFGD